MTPNEAPIDHTIILPKTIKFVAKDLNSHVSSLAALAGNNKVDTDQLIYFDIQPAVGLAYVSAKDPFRECTIEIPVVSREEHKFSVSSKKINEALTDAGDVEFLLSDTNVHIHQGDDQFYLDRKDFDATFRTTNLVEDEVNTFKFVSLIRVFESYLDSKELKYGLLLMSDNLIYTKNKLFFLTSPLPMNKEYVFDKATCKSICSFFNSKVGSTISLANPLGTHINLRSGNISFWCKSLSADTMDVRKFLRINPSNTFMVDAKVLAGKLKTLISIGESLDVDLKASGKVLQVSPAKDGTKTECRVSVEQLELNGTDNAKEFDLTVNASALYQVLSHVNTDRVIISNSTANVMLVSNLDENQRLHYFVNIF